MVLDKATIDSFAANPQIKDVSPMVNFAALVTYEGLTGNASIQGMKPSYFLYTGLKADVGELFTDKSATDDSEKVLVTTGLLNLFGVLSPAEAVGKTITFRVFVPIPGTDQTTEVDIQKKYTIKGVTSDQSSLGANMTLDEFQSHLDVPFYERVQVRVKDGKFLASVQDEILSKGFTVTALSKTVEQANKIFQASRLFSQCLAADRKSVV